MVLDKSNFEEIRAGDEPASPEAGPQWAVVTKSPAGVLVTSRPEMPGDWLYRYEDPGSMAIVFVPKPA